MKGNHISKAIAEKFAFKSDNALVITRNLAKGIFNWGKLNSRPEYLIKLSISQPQHGAIVDGKANYLTGLSIKAGTPAGNDWLKKANPTESWEQIRPKRNKDKTLYGGFAIKIIPNLVGRPLWFFHVDMGKLRMSDCYEKMKYSDDWTDHRCDISEYPIWYPGCKVPAIYYFKKYHPTARKKDGVYPPLEYDSALLDIDTETRISNYRNSIVKNNFSSGTVVTVFSGKPENEAEEKAIADAIKGNHTGDEQAGNVVVMFADPGDKPAEVSSIDPPDLYQQWAEVTKADQNNIYSSHRVPPELFSYISDTATVFDVNKIVEQNELFMNSYVIPNQKEELDMMKLLYRLSTGLDDDFEIEQFSPIGLDLPLDNPTIVNALNAISPAIIIEAIKKKYNLQIPAGTIQPGQTAPRLPAPVQQVNDHLKNLTAQQSMAMNRVVRLFKKGTYSAAQATILLKSYGLSDADITQFLSDPVAIQQRVQFAVQHNFFTLLDKYAHAVRTDDEVLEVNYFDGVTRFAADGPDTEMGNAVLNQIKANPELTNDEIATALGITAAAVAAAIAWLTAKKLLADRLPTLKAAKKTTIYTEYNYDKRPDVPGPVIMATTRDFCRNLYAKFKEGAKALTFEAIDRMTNEFGMDVWSFRGGFWHDPRTDETEPFCRHIWRGTTKIKYE